MAKEKSLVEEAIIQMKNLEEAVAENAKGILASTMKQEIKDLVKESLTEQADDEVETDDVEIEGPKGSEDIADIKFGDDTEDDGDDMDTDNMDDSEDDSEDEEDMDFDDEEDMDDEDTIDLTDADDDEVLRVFQLMGPDDNIVVTKDDKGNTHLKDEGTGKEYMIVGEGEEEEMDESWEEMDESDEEEEMDESIESIVERMFSSDDDMDDDEDEEEMDFEEFDENWGENKHDFKRRGGHKIGDVDGHYKDYEFDEDEDMDDESIVYEIEMDDEDDDEEEMDESIYESKKMTVKPVAPQGIGSESKFKYRKNPSLGDGFATPTKLKHADHAKPTRFTGKPKFEYKEGENAGDKLGKNKMVKKVESKEQATKKPMMKKAETKEAARVLGNGSNFRKGGLPKPYAHSKFNANIKESENNKELQILREKNEEYRKALNVFRSKLNEVAVFNSNLAYATRLFTEHSTSKQEKINILRRFDSVETIKESKNLYQVVKNELSAGTKTQSMNESIERTIAKSPSTGAVNLIESKTYENPQFLRMKDLMTKLK